MSDIVPRVIFDLLQFRRASAEGTKIFGKWMHNADLCPRFHNKIELILGAFKKYQQITYDIQGLRDRGSDVIVRQGTDEQTNFICLQIKSEEDFHSSDFLMKLKAQTFETQLTYTNLLDYYIIICTNLFGEKLDRETGKPAVSKEKKNRIRSIEAEYATAKNIHIIEPEYALTFLQLSSIQIDAAIKSKLGSEDIVFRSALNLVSDLTPTERCVVFYLIWLNIYQTKTEFTADEICNSYYIQSTYSNVPDHARDWFFGDDLFPKPDEEWDEFELEYFAELSQHRNLDTDSRIALDLEFLKDEFLSQHINGNYSIDILDLQPLVLLMMEGNVRYEYEGNELIDYMMNLFGPIKGYEPPVVDLQ